MLAHHFLGLAALRRGPPDDELLRSLMVWFVEMELNAGQRCRFIKDDAQQLFAIFGGAPAGPGVARLENRLDRELRSSDVTSIVAICSRSSHRPRGAATAAGTVCG